MPSIAEIPTPHTRFFSSASRKRRVEVTITMFHGTGSHFHAEMVEEHDRVFDSRTGEWVRPYDDQAGSGRSRFMKFRTEAAARRWIEATFEEEFDPDSHELVFSGDVNNEWFYGEGD